MSLTGQHRPNATVTANNVVTLGAAITVHAQASPPDAKRSHSSARLAWVTFWVTQKVPPR
jgi:hypothetical protein